MIHDQPHPLAGQTVKLALALAGPNLADGGEYVVEDYWDRISGGSWMDASGNPAAIGYAFRAGFGNLPTDNEVVYGKVGGLGHLVHVSELVDPADDRECGCRATEVCGECTSPDDYEPAEVTS